MPPSHPPLRPPPEPTRQIFDPFNSSSTGHQRAESRLSGSTSWRESRTHKLSHQLRDSTGRGGPRHLSDLVGAGSENFRLDGRKENGDWSTGAPGLREDGWRDIRDMMQGPTKVGGKQTPTGKSATSSAQTGYDVGTRQVAGEELQYWQGKLSTDKTLISTTKYNPLLKKPPDTTSHSTTASPPAKESEGTDSTPVDLPTTTKTAIFSGLNIYLNGSTLPHISDHKLKHLLAQHGANVSIALGRRTVTHVILGDKGGLAAGKLQKEIAKSGGKGIKFVGVRWVLDSIERGKRQPESRYEVVRIATRGQRNVFGTGVAPRAEKPSITNNDTT